MNDANQPPDPPSGLADRGQGFWTSMNSLLPDFNRKELTLLEEACRSLDSIEALAQAVDRDGLMVSGSKGQLVLHPAVSELRQQQLVFSRLMMAMRLPEDSAAEQQMRSKRARLGASARWERPMSQWTPYTQSKGSAQGRSDDWTSQVTVVGETPLDTLLAGHDRAPKPTKRRLRK